MSRPDFQPTLVGPTVTLRPISADDWPELFAAGSDPEIWKVHPAPDRYTEPEFRKFFDGAVNSKMGFVFVDRATGALIGSSRFTATRPSSAKSRSAGPSPSARIGAAPPTAKSSG
jgi:RimJ/RimL family protein N-acetyltransferase